MASPLPARVKQYFAGLPLVLTQQWHDETVGHLRVLYKGLKDRHSDQPAVVDHEFLLKDDEYSKYFDFFRVLEGFTLEFSEVQRADIAEAAFQALRVKEQWAESLTTLDSFTGCLAVFMHVLTESGVRTPQEVWEISLQLAQEYADEHECTDGSDSSGLCPTEPEISCPKTRRNKRKREMRKKKKAQLRAMTAKVTVRKVASFELPSFVGAVEQVVEYKGFDWSGYHKRKHAHRLRKEAKYISSLASRITARVVMRREADEKRKHVMAQRERLIELQAVKKLEEAAAAKKAEAEAFERKAARERRDTARRAERELRQREAAWRKSEEKRKSVPKEERERKVKSQRDKRVPVFQSGKALPAAIGVGATLLFGKLFQLLNKGGRAIDGVQALLDQFKRIGASLKEQLGKALWYIPIVLTAWFCSKQAPSGSTLALGVLIAALAKLVGPSVWSAISEFFPGGNVQSQSGFMDTFEAAPKLLATLFSFSVLRNKRPGSVTEFCKRLSMLERMASGWDSFLKWMLKGMEVLVNFVRTMFGKDRIQFFKDAHGPTYEWAKRVDEVCKSQATGGDVDADLLDEMVELVRQGFAYKEIYRGTNMARFVDDYVIRVVNVLMPYQGTLNARNNFRFEPSTLMVYGRPGIGKTLMAMHLCSAIMLEAKLVPNCVTFDDVVKQVWQKGSSEYWNGYAGQTCLVMDDAFQLRSVAGEKDNQYMDFIRMVSSWSFPLNFADLASKGKIYFNSKFIFGTTNLASIESEARIVIQDPEAVARRLNFPFCLRLKDEFKESSSGSGRLDYGKFMRECERCKDAEAPIDGFPWYIWEAAKHDFLTGTTSNQWVPLKEVIISIAEDLKTRSVAHEDSKESLKRYIARYSGSVSAQPELQSGLKTGGFPTHGLAAFSLALKENIRQHLEMHSVVKSTIGVVACVLLSVVAFKIIKGLLNFCWEMIAGLFGFGKRNKRVEKQSNRPPTKPRKAGIRDPVFQSVDTSVSSNVYANTYKLYATLDSGEIVIGQVMFLMLNLAAQPEHFTAQIKSMVADGQMGLDSKLILRNAANHEHVLTFTVQHYLSLRRSVVVNCDVEFIDFGTVRGHRNIVSNFMKESDLKHLPGWRCRLDICEVDANKRIVAVNKRQTYVLSSVRYGENLRAGGKHIKRYFVYNAPTDLGDCGAPLCILDNSTFSGRTCFGFHVAGDRLHELGYSAVITQEMIEKARAELEVVVDKFEQDLVDRSGVQFQACNELPFTVKGSFLPIGVVSRPVVICPKTSYYPTSLFGCMGEYDHLPAHLSPIRVDGELIFPMNNAVSNYASPLLVYEQPWLKQALHCALQPLSALIKDMPRRLYTFEEAILGIPQEKFRSIPRGTASGFPYVYDVRNGKKEFFGEEQDYNLTTERAVELRQRVEYVIDEASRGVRLAHVFVDFLKDELRPAAKVKAVATRLISSAPLDYTIAWRMYFGAFSSAVMRCHTKSGMAPGICVYTDWGLLVSRLTLKGEKCFDGDFKAFDSSEQPCVHDLILDYINRWYDDGPINARIRRVLWLDLVHSRHIGGLGADQRYIYQWNKSLPSGHPFTTIVNSMYSLFLLVGAYVSLTGDFTGFWEHVSSVTYGDDNVSNVDDNVCEVFNQVTVAEALQREFSVKYTPGNKSGEFEPYTSVTDLTFLKRGFLMRDNRWLCPLELDSFLYTCYWCKNRKLEKQITIDVLENALEELSMHDKRSWDLFAPQISDALEKRNHVTHALVEQDQYLQLVLSRSDNWY